jgi:hypothetical protein
VRASENLMTASYSLQTAHNLLQNITLSILQFTGLIASGGLL